MWPEPLHFRPHSAPPPAFFLLFTLFLWHCPIALNIPSLDLFLVFHTSSCCSKYSSLQIFCMSPFASGILVSWPGIKPMPLALGVHGLNSVDYQGSPQIPFLFVSLCPNAIQQKAFFNLSYIQELSSITFFLEVSLY